MVKMVCDKMMQYICIIYHVLRNSRSYYSAFALCAMLINRRCILFLPSLAIVNSVLMGS